MTPRPRICQDSMIKVALSALVSLLSLPIQAQFFTESQDIVGISHVYRQLFFNGGGAAFVDINNDGWDDLYLTGGNSMDQLYINNQDGTFSDISVSAGLGITTNYYTTGINFGDIDNDGYNDLFVTTFISSQGGPGKNLLFHNQGDGTFDEVWDNRTAKDNVWSMGAVLLDFDLDGDLDIYVVNYVEESEFIRDDANNIVGFNHTCYPNRFYENKGELRFEEISTEVGLEDEGCALAVTATDYDLDGDMDLLLANDFGEFIIPNKLFRNDVPSGQGFTEVGESLMAGQAIYGMGIAVGDVDNDSDLDYYITNLGRNLFLRNDRETFTDITDLTGTANTWTQDDSLYSVSWGAQFFDVDNDADLDLHVSNGYTPSSTLLPTEFPQPDILYLQSGSLFFESHDTLGIQPNLSVSRGSAISDFDMDGDVDLLSVVFDRPPLINDPKTLFYLNNGNENHWISFRLHGVSVNRNAFGSKVYVHTNGSARLFEVSGGSSHCSQNSSVVHVGLGQNESVDSVVIQWTGGNSKQIIFNPSINEHHVIVEDTLNNDMTTSILPVQLPLTSIYPNPTNDVISITNLPVTEPSKVKVIIYDIQGRKLSSSESTFNGSLQVQMGKLSVGTYILEIHSGTSRFTSKISKIP